MNTKIKMVILAEHVSRIGGRVLDLPPQYINAAIEGKKARAQALLRWHLNSASRLGGKT